MHHIIFWWINNKQIHWDLSIVPKTITRWSHWSTFNSLALRESAFEYYGKAKFRKKTQNVNKWPIFFVDWKWHLIQWVWGFSGQSWEGSILLLLMRFDNQPNLSQLIIKYTFYFLWVSLWVSSLFLGDTSCFSCPFLVDFGIVFLSLIWVSAFVSSSYHAFLLSFPFLPLTVPCVGSGVVYFYHCFLVLSSSGSTLFSCSTYACF